MCIFGGSNLDDLEHPHFYKIITRKFEKMTSQSSNSSLSSNNTDNIDIFSKLPEHVIGYVLTFLQVNDFFKSYEYLQGRSISLSRSNLIFSKGTKLAITSISVRDQYRYGLKTFKFIQSFSSTYEAAVAKLLPLLRKVCV